MGRGCRFEQFSQMRCVLIDTLKWKMKKFSECPFTPRLTCLKDEMNWWIKWRMTCDDLLERMFDRDDPFPIDSIRSNWEDNEVHNVDRVSIDLSKGEINRCSSVHFSSLHLHNEENIARWESPRAVFLRQFVERYERMFVENQRFDQYCPTDVAVVFRKTNQIDDALISKRPSGHRCLSSFQERERVSPTSINDLNCSE